MMLDRIDIQELLEGDFGDLFRYLFILNIEATLFGIQNEEPFVIEGEGEEFNFLRHLVQVSLHLIFPMLNKLEDR